MSNSTFDAKPVVKIKGFTDHCFSGWEAIGKHLQKTNQSKSLNKTIVVFECYPGVSVDVISNALNDTLQPECCIHSLDAFYPEEFLRTMLESDLTDDPVFGKITNLTYEDFLHPQKKSEIQKQILSIESGNVLVIGPAASLLAAPDILVYADLPRWEAQLRFRRNESDNLGCTNRGEAASLQYKQAFFVDWRVADRLKQQQFEQWDYWLDTVVSDSPKMVSGDAIREALRRTVERPFSVVPFFDPAPWGGSWMMEKFGLDPSKENYGWCFNCVPEENSLLIDFENVIVESPSINAVFYQPEKLLGKNAFCRFGAEFPIRFDFLDTINGGNLSFQVHPITEYIQQQIGMNYTQDESYYMLDAKEGASVFLGLKDNIVPNDMLADLRSAQNGGAPFHTEKYINQWPAKKHDHFLIPAGTPHCSGQGSMVLEISATPYIFTFKLWDWGRLGLDGKPRPIHLRHGENVIQWDRTTEWTQRELINRCEAIAEGDGWREERTGLHELEFIETRRHWFTKPVLHDTQQNMNVICLVEGDAVIVDSPDGEFDPWEVHFAEVFIVPASVGRYRIAPCSNQQHVTLKAFVRPKI
ncbi:class I mannose-6-phosphate isomerase [bacterium]|nr:class I mannose-6-phosphate isomerase [bacterium]